MKRVLENDFLKVTIDDHGAELVSIYDKEKDREYPDLCFESRRFEMLKTIQK